MHEFHDGIIGRAEQGQGVFLDTLVMRGGEEVMSARDDLLLHHHPTQHTTIIGVKGVSHLKQDVPRRCAKMVAASHFFIGHQVKGGHSCEGVLFLEHLTLVLFFDVDTGLLADLKSEEDEIAEDLLTARTILTHIRRILQRTHAFHKHFLLKGQLSPSCEELVRVALPPTGGAQRKIGEEEGEEIALGRHHVVDHDEGAIWMFHDDLLVIRGPHLIPVILFTIHVGFEHCVAMIGQEGEKGIHFALFLRHPYRHGVGRQEGFHAILVEIAVQCDVIGDKHVMFGHEAAKGLEGELIGCEKGFHV